MVDPRLIERKLASLTELVKRVQALRPATLEG